MDWQWLATWLVILFSAVTVLRRIPGLRGSVGRSSAGCGGCGGCSSVTRGSGTATPLVQLGVGGVSGPTAGVAAEGHD
ncbi:MAG: hypothetical protein ACOVRM_04465 [Planctomycetaceae bacterium]|jgi:hypothetical protein